MWHKWHLVHTSYFLKIFDGVWCHVDGNMHGNDMQMRLCIVQLGVVSYMVISGRRWGGDTRTHNLSLSGSHKGIFCTCSGVF